LNVYNVNMPDKGNTVNIKKRYHHGDLRAALLQAGLELLKTHSVDTLSLREVARAVGVSATAVYRHFPDKQSLLYALCAFIADDLQAMQKAAMAEAGGGMAGFAAQGQAYVRYALKNPTAFRLLMTTRPSGGAYDFETSHVHSAMRMLIDNVGALLPPGTPAKAKRLVVVQAWALVHGMAMLMLDGQIEPDDSLIAGIGRDIGDLIAAEPPPAPVRGDG
jgi:AcrR family transcriptional regulator